MLLEQLLLLRGRGKSPLGYVAPLAKEQSLFDAEGLHRAPDGSTAANRPLVHPWWTPPPPAGPTNNQLSIITMFC